jgi:hypothetical protein
MLALSTWLLGIPQAKAGDLDSFSTGVTPQGDFGIFLNGAPKLKVDRSGPVLVPDSTSSCTAIRAGAIR